jgi:hypothetical protein
VDILVNYSLGLTFAERSVAKIGRCAKNSQRHFGAITATYNEAITFHFQDWSQFRAAHGTRTSERHAQPLIAAGQGVRPTHGGATRAAPSR